MYAYVDETGNDGPNVFNPDQPFFMTGALVTRGDFDLVYGHVLKQLSSERKLNGLHAKQLGQAGVDVVADDILRLLKKSDARLALVCVEKAYLVVAKVTDTLLDPVENKAVPLHVYNTRVMRMVLLFAIHNILTDELRLLFWSAATSRKETESTELFGRFCGELLPRTELIADKRAKEILVDAIVWGRDHPGDFNLHPGTKFVRHGQNPNIVGFLNLLECLELQSKAWNSKLKRLKHDRQMEFEVSLRYWHELMSTGPEVMVRTAWDAPEKKFQLVMDSQFEMSSSSDSAGIQVIDIVLWLTRRMMLGAEVPDGAGRLLRYIEKRTTMRQFSFDGMQQQLRGMLHELYAPPFGPEQEAAGKMFSEELEARRQKAMRMHLEGR